MLIRNHRIILVLLNSLMLGACSGFCGYLTVRTLCLRSFEGLLDSYAAQMVRDGDASSAQALSLLRVANASPLPHCSDDELEHLRRVLLFASYLKDIGHVRDGRIACSASMGRMVFDTEPLKPDYHLADGAAVYGAFDPMQDRTLRRIALQMGESYVVLGELPTPPPAAIPASVTITLKSSGSGPGGLLVGGFPQSAGRAFEHPGRGVVEEVLYATRCSPQFVYCLTLHVPVSIAQQSGRGMMVIGARLGGGVGVMLGLVLALIVPSGRSLEQQLRRAIRRDALDVAYQPIYDIGSGRLVAAEALARWKDEDGFEVSPEVFIRIAEERGFCGKITRLMLRRILQALVSQLKDYPSIYVNLNITGSDLRDPNFAAMLEQQLRQAGISARRVGLEITESQLASHLAGRKALRELRRRGHLIHLDDFGTGYSSLAYLNELTIDVLKIDKAFTHSIGTESVKVSILPKILSMAETLQLRVIVEGVETEEQAAYLATLAQPILAQGWYFGRTMPLENLVELLRDEMRNDVSNAAARTCGGIPSLDAP